MHPLVITVFIGLINVFTWVIKVFIGLINLYVGDYGVYRVN